MSADSGQANTQKPMLALLMSLEESISRTNINDLECSIPSLMQNTTTSKDASVSLVDSDLAVKPHALANSHRQDSALDEATLQSAHTDCEKDSERRDSALEDLLANQLGQPSIDIFSTVTETVTETCIINDTIGSNPDACDRIKDTESAVVGAQKSVYALPGSRRSSTTEDLDQQKKILSESKNKLKKIKTNTEEYRKTKAIIRETKSQIEEIKTDLDDQKKARKTIAIRKNSSKGLKAALSRKLSNSSGNTEPTTTEVAKGAEVPSSEPTEITEPASAMMESTSSEPAITTFPTPSQRRGSTKCPQSLDALPFKVESVPQDSELVGTGIVSIRDLHLELNVMGQQRTERDAKATISAKYGLNKAKTSATTCKKPRHLCTYEFGEVRDKSSMTTVHLKAPEYHSITPTDTLHLEVYMKAPFVPVKRHSTVNPKLFQWVKKGKKNRSNVELDLSSVSLTDERLLGEATLSFLHVLNNLTPEHTFSSQFRSTNNCMLLKPYTYEAHVTVYVKDSYKEGWLDVQKNTTTRIQQWELYYAVLSGTDISLYREPPSEGRKSVPVDTLNLLQIKNDTIGMTNESKRGNSFRVDSEQFSYFCSADSAEDLTAWSDSFNEALHGIRQWLESNTHAAHRPSLDSVTMGSN